MAKWNDIPLTQDTPKEELASQLDKQWEENKAAGEAKQAEDPYRRPQPTAQKPSWSQD